MVVLTKGDVSESGYKGFNRLFTKDFLDDFAKGDSLLIKNGDDVVTHINLYNSGAAVANLKQCVAYLKGINAEKRDREAQWDYIKKDPFTPKNPYADPAAKLAPNQTAIAKGEVSLWVTGNDYPLRDLQQENEGKVSFTLKIGPDGRVISCDITISSGYPGLDQATCANVSRKARFIPATDTEAKPIEGTYSTAVRWNIPQAVTTIDSPTQ